MSTNTEAVQQCLTTLRTNHHRMMKYHQYAASHQAVVVAEALIDLERVLIRLRQTDEPAEARSLRSV